MAKYIKPDRSSWTHDQLEHELENSMKLYRTAMKQYMDDQSTITAQEGVIKRLKEDADRLVIAGNDLAKYLTVADPQEKQLDEIEDWGATITLHTDLMNDIEKREG